MNMQTLHDYQLVDHIREVLQPADVFSFVRPYCQVNALLDALLAQPGCKTEDEPQDDALEVPADNYQPRDEEHMFVRLVHPHPRLMKTIPMPKAIGGKIDDRCIAVSQLQVAFTGEGAIVSNGSTSDTLLVGHFASDQCMQHEGGIGDILAWERDSKKMFTFKGALQNTYIEHDDFAAASWAIAEMLANGARPGFENVWLCPASHTRVLEAMEAAGHTCRCRSHGNGWQLTLQGVASLQVARPLLWPPKSLTAPRPGTAIKDSTSYELLTMLKDQGWERRQLPSARAKQLEVVPYSYPDGDKDIFTAGLAVGRQYLQCLLNAAILCSSHGITEIPHGMPEQVYIDLASG